MPLTLAEAVAPQDGFPAFSQRLAAELLAVKFAAPS
jgi:hypothetical protein